MHSCTSDEGGPVFLHSVISCWYSNAFPISSSMMAHTISMVEAFCMVSLASWEKCVGYLCLLGCWSSSCVSSCETIGMNSLLSCAMESPDKMGKCSMISMDSSTLRVGTGTGLGAGATLVSCWLFGLVYIFRVLNWLVVPLIISLGCFKASNFCFPFHQKV